MEETLTLRRLGVDGALWRTLSSTNPCESMIECIRRAQERQALARRGDVAALDRGGDARGRAQFRRVIGYRQLSDLALAVEREVAPAFLPSPTPKEVREAVTV